MALFRCYILALKTSSWILFTPYARLLAATMARQPTRRLLNGAVRRGKLRDRSKNTRWMHLGASAVGTRQLIQRCWARHTYTITFILCPFNWICNCTSWYRQSTAV